MRRTKRPGRDTIAATVRRKGKRIGREVVEAARTKDYNRAAAAVTAALALLPNIVDRTVIPTEGPERDEAIRQAVVTAWDIAFAFVVLGQPRLDAALEVDGGEDVP